MSGTDETLGAEGLTCCGFACNTYGTEYLSARLPTYLFIHLVRRIPARACQRTCEVLGMKQAAIQTQEGYRTLGMYCRRIRTEPSQLPKRAGEWDMDGFIAT